MCILWLAAIEIGNKLGTIWFSAVKQMHRLSETNSGRQNKREL